VRIVLEPQGAAVSGTVLDPRGEPLAHAQVLLGKEESYDSYKLEGGGDARVPAAQCTSTDEHGQFQFAGAPLGRLEVQARGKGCAPWKGEVETSSGVRAELVIRMQKGSSLAGRVTDATGNPVARAEVQVGQYGFASRYTRADGDGRFRIESLPLGEFEASAQSDGHESAKTKLFGASDVQLEWNPVLGSGLAIRGRLVARDIDFSKWWMYCESQDWQKAPYAQSATPKADGSFEFAGCGDARHRIRIHAPDANLYPVVTVEAQPGGEPLLVSIDAAMLPSCHLRGRFVDEAGQPLAGAQFSPVLAGSGFTPIETTDANGRFDLGPAPPGEYWIRARVQGYVGSDSERVTLAADASWDFGDLRLVRGGTIAVRLARPSSKPVAVELLREGAEVVWIQLQDGTGRTEALAPGEYVLRPWVDGTLVEASSVYPRVTLRAGEENSVELELP
jgi:protocatechuate 3,4-dioxygenase beta subunit